MRRCQRPLHKLRLRADGLIVAPFAPGTMTAINSDDQARSRPPPLHLRTPLNCHFRTCVSAQLRQRVAWGLYQVFVVSDKGISGSEQQAEIWHAYYDMCATVQDINVPDCATQIVCPVCVPDLYVTHLAPIETSCVRLRTRR